MKSTNWKDKAELAGIIAIVASLLFVGLQLRQDRELALAEAISEYVSIDVDFQLSKLEHADILVKGNSGARLDEVEQYKLRTLVEAAQGRVFLSAMAQRDIGGNIDTTELIFAAFLYRNPSARSVWLQMSDDMERYVDPLRNPESLARTKATGSSAFRSRVKAHLAKLDGLYGE